MISAQQKFIFVRENHWEISTPMMLDDVVDKHKKIIEHQYREIKILKDTARSLVKLIELDGDTCVLKIPKEKNRRKWQRFISFVRGHGEAKRVLKNM